MFYQIHHMASSEYFQREEGMDFSYPTHLHQGFELILLTEGEMKVTINQQEFSLKAGESILVFPNELHSLTSEHSRHILFIFSEKLIRAFCVKYAGLVPNSRIITPSPYLCEALCSLSSASTSVELKGVLYSYAALLEKQADFTQKLGENGDIMQRIFAFVEENYLKSCTLADLSISLGYNHSYISRLFMRMTGMHYNSYVNMRRLSSASYLLRNSDLSVLECSIESGYRSLRSFNRNFKEFFGISPAEYRSENAAGDF